MPTILVLGVIDVISYKFSDSEKKKIIGIEVVSCSVWGNNFFANYFTVPAN